MADLVLDIPGEDAANHPDPAELGEFLAGPHPCVMATVRADSTPVTVARWYEYADGRVLLSMEQHARRVANLHANPAVSLTVLADDWYSYVSMLGRVVEFAPDPDYSMIDRLSTRYSGVPYPERDTPLVTAIVEIARWYTYGAPGAGSDDTA